MSECLRGKLCKNKNPYEIQGFIFGSALYIAGATHVGAQKGCLLNMS